MVHERTAVPLERGGPWDRVCLDGRLSSFRDGVGHRPLRHVSEAHGAFFSVKSP